MQISATTPLLPVPAIDRTTSGQTYYKPTDPLAKVRTDAQVNPAPKVFTPAPPLRPNVQDFVDIDRTLISLRQASI